LAELLVTLLFRPALLGRPPKSETQYSGGGFQLELSGLSRPRCRACLRGKMRPGVVGNRWHTPQESGAGDRFPVLALDTNALEGISAGINRLNDA